MLARNPLVSVLVPAFNAERYISKAIRSVLNQTYTNIELIIINDGSTDRTVSIVNQFSDHRIRLFNQPNLGQCKALNFALKNAKGDFIKFLDADDFINEIHIEKMLSVLFAVEADKRSKTLILSKWQRFINEEELLPVINRPEWSDNQPIDFLMKAMGNGPDMLPGWQWLIPKNIIDEVGGWNENLGLGNDFEFSIRLVLGSDSIRICDDAIVYYRSALQTNMSSSTKESTIMSVLQASRLGIERIRNYTDNKILKRACADKLQVWLLSYYPYIKRSLAKEVEKQVAQLGGSNVNADWDKKLLLLKKLIGWKAAKLLQYYYYKLRYK